MRFASLPLLLATSSLVACNLPGNALVPSVVPTPSVSGMPTSSPSTTPSGVPTASSAPTFIPTPMPTAAPNSAPLPINTPVPSPTTSPSSVTFLTGLVTTQSFSAFHGSVNITFPISDNNGGGGTYAYAGYPNTLPSIPGASNVLGLLRLTDGVCCGVTTQFAAGRTMQLVYTPSIGTPSGNFHIAFYRPTLDVAHGFYSGYGTSSISGNTVTVDYTLPSTQELYQGGDAYFALYQ